MFLKILQISVEDISVAGPQATCKSLFFYISLFFPLERSSLYHTTNVCLAFTERTAYDFHHNCAIQHWLVG